MVLFVVGIYITGVIIRFNFPDFTPLAIFVLLTGIGFIVAGYGLWLMKKWGAILAIILCVVKLIQIGYNAYSAGFNFAFFNAIYALISYIVVFTGLILMIYFQEWKKLK